MTKALFRVSIFTFVAKKAELQEKHQAGWHTRLGYYMT